MNTYTIVGICVLKIGHYHLMESILITEDLCSSSEEYCNKDQQSSAGMPKSNPQGSLTCFELPPPVLVLKMSTCFR